tara:strand:+ start:305 stop:865 length:561 start_codon:yes stop_codon:yes gene_type:complete
MVKKFCDNCSNILYTRNKDKNKLQYYCKNCDYTLDYNKDQYCVYINKINNDYLIYKNTNNKWIIKDPTIPVLNNIQCINNNCIINNYIDNSYIIYETDIKIIEDIIKKLNLKIDTTKLDNKYIFTFSSKEIFINNEKKLIDICNQKKIEIEKNIKNDNKVSFVKHDNNNMKYLYICHYCNSSWVNN